MLKDSFYYTVSIPSAFTPNGDGNNDILFIKLFGVKKLISFKIFNRFGQMLFMTEDENQGWDGYYKGTPQNSEVYFYTYEIETYEPKRIVGNGNLLLLH
jgi:gliding motility-associated-like protein